MMQERQQLLQPFGEDIRKMQKLAHRDSERMVENQKLCGELQSKMQELARRDSERMVENQKLCAELQSKMQELARRDSERMVENQKLCAELRSNMQELARIDSQRMVENQKLCAELQSNMQELARTDSQRMVENQKLCAEAAELESKMHDLRSIAKHLNQLPSQSNPERIFEEYKEEMEKLVSRDKLHMLEKKLVAKQKLDLDIKQLQGKLEAIKHMQGDEDSESKKKMDELGEELQDNYDAMESLVRTLLIRERICNDELQDARKALISGLQDFTTGKATIGIKRMGALDLNSLAKACERKMSKDDAQVTASILCSSWEDEIRRPEWHPFRVIMVDGKAMVEISLLLLLHNLLSLILVFFITVSLILQ